MSEKVYKWMWDCGRGGSIDGLFVATEQAVANAVGKGADFGEVLGKHSEVAGTLEAGEFTPLTDNEAVVAFVKEHGPFGFDPLYYAQDECEGTCGSFLSKNDGIEWHWCHSCELRICYDCASDEEHETCDPTVLYEKRGEAPKS